MEFIYLEHKYLINTLSQNPVYSKDRVRGTKSETTGEGEVAEKLQDPAVGGTDFRCCTRLLFVCPYGS